MANPVLRNLLLYIALFFLVWSIRATVLFPLDERISSPDLRRIYADVIRVLFWVVPVLLYVRLVDRRPPGAYVRLSTPVDRKGLLQGAVVVTVYFAGGLVVFCLLKGVAPRIEVSDIGDRWFELLLALTIVPLAEETLFRGFLLEKFRGLLDFWKANLATALLFVAIHWPNWLFTRGLQPDLLLDSGKIFIMAMLLGYLVRKTNSLWPSIVTHLLNNSLAALLVFG